MLRLKEFVKAINLNWASGERPYGYDHDAQCFTGPRDHQGIVVNEYQDDQIPKMKSSAAKRKPSREFYEDPATGDILLRSNKK